MVISRLMCFSLYRIKIVFIQNESLINFNLFPDHALTRHLEHFGQGVEFIHNISSSDFHECIISIRTKIYVIAIM